MTPQEFLDKYNGVGIDFDGFYGNQCMDEFLQYNQDVVNAPRVYGNAVDVWTNYPTAFYDQIPNTPDNCPQLGDVIIWGTGIGQYGHIAVCQSADVNSFTSLDQNWNNVQFCQFITHNYNAVLGWLRPKLQPVTVTPAPLPEPNPGYAPTFAGQTVSLNGLTYRSYDNNGQLLWNVAPNDPVPAPEVVSPPVEVPITVTTSSSPVVQTSTTDTSSATFTVSATNPTPSTQTMPLPTPTKPPLPLGQRIVFILLSIKNALLKYVRRNAKSN